MKIKDIKAIEVLDSRGIPTIQTTIELWSGDIGTCSVPSGASTGENEVLELRDGDKERYMGKGVLKAVENVNTVIRNASRNRDFDCQLTFDNFLKDLDGTNNKSKLGGNSILSCSIAFCRACANTFGLDMYKYIGLIYYGDKYNEKNISMPKPSILMMEGAKHGNWSTDIQEYMITPSDDAFNSFSDTLRASSEIFYAIHDVLDSKGYSTGVGYEGAYAPRELKSNQEAFDIIMDGIKKARYENMFNISLDVASSEFFNKESNKYELKRENKSLSTEEWIQFQDNLFSQYPIYSIEDPIDQNQWNDWSIYTSKLGNRYQIVGDDLLVTNTSLIQKGIENRCMNAVLIKPNQIGSVSETLDAIKLTRDSNMNAIVSHRSGETCDTFISDLVIGTDANQCKFGAPNRGERVCKYNRLLEIESNL